MKNIYNYCNEKLTEFCLNNKQEIERVIKEKGKILINFESVLIKYEKKNTNKQGVSYFLQLFTGEEKLYSIVLCGTCDSYVLNCPEIMSNLNCGVSFNKHKDVIVALTENLSQPLDIEKFLRS